MSRASGLYSGIETGDITERKEVKYMNKIWNYIQMKLKEEKGEVSVEWALVAVIMAFIILGVFSPGVKEALNQAIDGIKSAISSASAG